MSKPADIIGKRVKLLHPHWLLDLPNPWGTVERPDQHGYYLVKLDQPGWYTRNGNKELLTHVLEAEDNMTWADQGPPPDGWEGYVF